MLPLRLIGMALVAYGGYVMISKSALAAYTNAVGSVTPTDAQGNPVDPSTDILARTIWGEARGEGAEGMQAVANVIMNRVARPGWWGSDVQSVCLASQQFSCWLPGDPNLVRMVHVTNADPQFSLAQQIAEAAVTGNLSDVTGGATSYYNPSVVNPSWASSMTVTAQIGHHVFLA